jgi:uncharacterized membrane protein YeiH
MDYSETAIFIMEIVGTVAFASSGAILAIHREMDLFGVIVLGVTTSVGGGLVRDLILGIVPPGMFSNPVYTMVAIGVSLLVFLWMYFRAGSSRMAKKVEKAYEEILFLSDSVGLGIFTVVGVNTARNAGYDQTFLLVFVGVLTGVGGGLMRDIMAEEKPYILHKHVYAVASIAGAVLCVYSGRLAGRLVSMTAGAALVLLLRVLAARYRWNLPKIRL